MIFSLVAKENDYSNIIFYIDTAVSFSISEFSNMSLGVECFFTQNANNKSKIAKFFNSYHYYDHFFGIDYKWNISNDNYSNIVQFYYCFGLFADYFDEFIYWTTPLGINIGYNFNNNNLIIGPKVGYYLTFLLFFISTDYSYNIVINNILDSYHQITLKIGILLGPY